MKELTAKQRETMELANECAEKLGRGGHDVVQSIIHALMYQAEKSTEKTAPAEKKEG
jgi:hypothetical protein